MKLAHQQTQVYDMVMDWYFNQPEKPYFVLSGYAGTGKTTLAKYIAERLGDVLFCAYTGKAASVLSDKGCTPSSTIHALLYVYKGKDEKGDIEFSTAPSQKIYNANLVIVDEYSMLPDNIIKDLLETRKRILFLGDPFQLPPVKKNQTPLTPDFELTEIHRQALDSPILRAATKIREGEPLSFQDDGDFVYKPSHEINFEEQDQIIVGRNNTKDRINFAAKKQAGTDNLLVAHGEKVICILNNKNYGLLNGMIGTATNPVYKSARFMQFDFYDGVKYYPNLRVWPFDMASNDNKEEYVYDSQIQRFQYAYAITCHKSQGSEFDTILVVNEKVHNIDHARWLYTALTRAKRKCVITDNVRNF